MISQIGVGHGRFLSSSEALVYLYYEEVKCACAPKSRAGPTVTASCQGHAGPALYTLLAMKGYFDKETLLTEPARHQAAEPLRHEADHGHRHDRGLAWAGARRRWAWRWRRMERKDYRVYCIVGDGEQQEGQIWEAAMYAGSQELDNLVVLVDDNGMRIDDYTDAINAVRPLDKR